MEARYRAVFYNKENLPYLWTYPKGTYDEAEEAIKYEEEKVLQYDVQKFAYAQVEKIYVPTEYNLD